MAFHWSLSDSKSLQVSRTLLCILADLNNNLVWIISTHPLISKFPVSVLWWQYRVRQLLLVSLSLLCSLVFSALKQGLDTFLSFRFLSVLPCGQLERQSPLFSVFFFLLTVTRSGRPAEIRLVSPNPFEFCASHFLRQILACVYTICSYNQIQTSCTVPRWSPSSPSRV